MYCFKCKTEKPEVKMGQTGTMVTVEQRCASCHGSKQFKWQSQPCLLGRYPAGNILLSFFLLMAGDSIPYPRNSITIENGLVLTWTPSK